MKTTLLCLIAVFLLFATCVLAQVSGVVSESFVAQAQANRNKEVMIKGTIDRIIPDTSTNTVVYVLTDKYNQAIRIRTEKGTPNLGTCYVVRGVVIAPAGSTQLEIQEHEKYTPPHTPFGQPEPDWAFAASAETTAGAAGDTGAGEGAPTGGGAGAGGETASEKTGAKEGETEQDGSKTNLPYLLLGGGAILVIAAVAIGLSMKSANDRRLREEQMRVEHERLADTQRQEAQRQAEMQRVAAQPAPTVAGVPSAPVAPIGTMVIWGQLTAVSGPLKDKVFPLPHGAIRVGRTEGDVVLEEDQSVSSKHATISQVGDGSVYFEDHSTNGSFVNERRLNNEKVPLQSGDKIVIGPHTLEIKFSKAALATPAAAPSSAPGAATVVVPAQQAATVAFSGLQLVVEEGPDQGKAFPVDPPQTTIGRENRDVLLTDEHVSRKHAVILNQDGKWILQNESNQGTIVNGAKVESVELQDGDTIRLGTTVLRFKRLV
ncbi:FHA domain-containing protein [bacterium]|nr:FHA domain-containing protein [bacterium]